eukprot:11219264-Lingulodinium_polyedra.AAC.1
MFGKRRQYIDRLATQMDAGTGGTWKGRVPNSEDLFVQTEHCILTKNSQGRIWIKQDHWVAPSLYLQERR